MHRRISALSYVPERGPPDGFAERQGSKPITTSSERLDPEHPSGGLAAGAWRLVDRSGITPNAVTVAGMLGIFAAGGLVLARQWVLASLVFIVAGLVDSVDGLIARHQGRSTRFGAFLDSTLDRIAEGAILGALGVVMAQDGRDWVVGACFAALTGSFVVSYARARAEGLAIAGSSGGLMGRPERLVLVGAALFLGGLGQITEVLIAVLAVLSLITALHRILIVYRASDAGADRARARERRGGGDRRRGRRRA